MIYLDARFLDINMNSNPEKVHAAEIASQTYIAYRQCFGCSVHLKIAMNTWWDLKPN